jgi:hypothetical protein
MRMADGVHFEFDDEQHSLAIFAELAQIVSENEQAFLECGKVLQDGAKRGHIAVDFLLEDLEEDIFFVFEIGVKSAACFACFGGDVLNAGVLKSIAGKNGLLQAQGFFAGRWTFSGNL